MIETVAEHSFQTLRPNSLVLDIGCLGFLFTDEMRARGHIVHAVDIQQLNGFYDRIAITNYDGLGWIKHESDKQATRFFHQDQTIPLENDSLVESVSCCKLSSYSKFKEVDFWDLIKIDVEGSELEIIRSLEQAPARQLSIEFHLHTGVYKLKEVEEMVDKLKSLGYKIAKHDFYSAHGCSGNFWDSLFVL